jgi:hypothetical protein
LKDIKRKKRNEKRRRNNNPRPQSQGKFFGIRQGKRG